jgi:hypothetical protein
MRKIAALSARDRRDLYTETGVRMGLPPFHVEKDFWVCWTLSTLFTDKEVGPHLTFRGGTSLSKCWGLIDRFSEDIDLSIARDWFPNAKSPAEAGITKSEREKRLKALRDECRTMIADVFCPMLERAASALPETVKIEVEPLDKARDPFCIHLHYPSTGMNPPADYNRAAVKIELSGRAEGWPMELRAISPYAAQQFPNLDSDSTLTLSCVRPERTFWEKAALIHEQNVRPGDKALAPRQARHLYDLARLWPAVRDAEGLHSLFDGVVAHRKGFFDYHWVDYDTLCRSSLQLIPPDARLPEWRADYDAMKTMFFSHSPDFGEILASLEGIQSWLWD